MKNKLIWLILILIVIAVIFSVADDKNSSNDEFRPLEINVGDEFTYIDYGNTMYVLNYMMEDVNGDGKKDMIMAIGEKKSVDDVSASNMDLVIFEPNQGEFYNLKLKKFNGDMPRIESAEVTGDGINDIMLMATNSADGTQVIRIISFTNGDFKEILKEKDNKGIVFAGEFLDGFKAYLKCSKYNKEVNLDLSDRKENYITKGFFDESGRLLKENTKIKTSNFYTVELVQLDGYLGIQTIQRIVGFDGEDFLDEIIAIWKYENGKWVLKEAKGNNVGNLLY